MSMANWQINKLAINKCSAFNSHRIILFRYWLKIMLVHFQMCNLEPNVLFSSIKKKKRKKKKEMFSFCTDHAHFVEFSLRLWPNHFFFQYTNAEFNNWQSYTLPWWFYGLKGLLIPFEQFCWFLIIHDFIL